MVILLKDNIIFTGIRCDHVSKDTSISKAHDVSYIIESESALITPSYPHLTSLMFRDILYFLFHPEIYLHGSERVFADTED